MAAPLAADVEVGVAAAAVADEGTKGDVTADGEMVAAAVVVAVVRAAAVVVAEVRAVANAEVGGRPAQWVPKEMGAAGFRVAAECIFFGKP